MHHDELQHLRHSLAHLLAAAVLDLHPDAKRTIGPAVDDGFYYDFAFASPISDEELPKIEAKMRELMPTFTEFARKEVSADEARSVFADNKYKTELINEFSGDGQSLTLYTSGSYIDLCRGGHAERLDNVDPECFTLTKLAGAYWRGDEKNDQLTRIYGVAFATKAERDAHLAMIEEAKKRDHKSSGPSSTCSSSLTWWEAGCRCGRRVAHSCATRSTKWCGDCAVRVATTVSKFHTSPKGLVHHERSLGKVPERLVQNHDARGPRVRHEAHELPAPQQIYARKQWSYRNLPQRYANTTTCYRDGAVRRAFRLVARACVRTRRRPTCSAALVRPKRRFRKSGTLSTRSTVRLA